jgi:[protein-PII] uridylyltransferase
VRQAVDVADSDLKAMLGLLDARRVGGDRSLVDELQRRTLAQWRGRLDRWMPKLEASLQERHERAGAVPFALEPELKEAKGGLRDVAVVRALARATPIVELTQDFAHAADTLFAVRVAVQRLARRADDRLLLDYQDEVGHRLGLGDADALSREVAAAGRVVAWHMDDAVRSVRATLAGPRGRSSAGRDVVLAEGLVRRDGEISLTSTSVPGSDLTLVLRAAAIAAHLGLPIARLTLQRFAREAAVLDGPWPADAKAALIELLGAGEGTVQVFETLDRYGLVERILPEWQAVRSRPQRNAFHRFTVDRHLVESAVRAAALTQRVDRADLLLVGSWLHDLGKGYPGDHTDVGVALMRVIATRIGYTPDDVEALVAMVRHHLLLPSIAMGLDLDEPETIERVATAVGDIQLLELLHALTEADSLATGPTAWTAWKARLVGVLVEKVRRTLEGADHVATRAVPGADDSLVERAGGQLLVEGTASHLVVAAPDQPRLFSRVVGLLALHGHDVRAARANSVNDVAISEYDIAPHLDTAPDWSSFEQELGEVLGGSVDLDARLVHRADRYQQLRRPQAAHLPPSRVGIDNDASPLATVLEIRATDSLGVLYRIAHVLADHRLDIRHAKVSTLGPEVIDTFYVVTEAQAKLTDPREVAEVVGAIIGALGAA